MFSLCSVDSMHEVGLVREELSGSIDDPEGLRVQVEWKADIGLGIFHGGFDNDRPVPESIRDGEYILLQAYDETGSKMEDQVYIKLGNREDNGSEPSGTPIDGAYYMGIYQQAGEEHDARLEAVFIRDGMTPEQVSLDHTHMRFEIGPPIVDVGDDMKNDAPMDRRRVPGRDHHTGLLRRP